MPAVANKRLISKGWDNYRSMVIPADAGEVQLKESRQAFLAGAAVLFATLMRVLDADEEPTEGDMQIMADLQAEIDEFGQTLDQRYFGKRKH